MIQRLIDILHREQCSLVVDNGNIRTFNGRGIYDLYHLLTKEPEILSCAYIADKVVGKGAAALMILGNVHEVFADVISAPAIQLLQNNGVRLSFVNEVSHIINRMGNGICPIEKLCASCKTANECFPLIKNFINNNNTYK